MYESEEPDHNIAKFTLKCVAIFLIICWILYYYDMGVGYVMRLFF